MPPKTPDPKTAEAADAEANGVRRVLTIGEGDDAITIEIPRKFKRLRFVRRLRSGDIGGALDAIWPPTPVVDEKGKPVLDLLGQPVSEPHPEVAKLEDADLTDEEFDQVMEALGSALGVQSAGNSSASPSS